MNKEEIITLLDKNGIISLDNENFNLNPSFLVLFDSYLVYNPPAKALFLCMTAYCSNTTEHEIVVMAEAFNKILSTINNYKYLSWLINQEIHKDK